MAIWKIASGIAAKAFMENPNKKNYDTVLVVFRSGPKKYAYVNPGFDISKGDMILVPTESGNDLEATVVMRTNAKRWKNKATKVIIG